VEKIEARYLLKSLQGNYLRAAVGNMKTTPTKALEVALCSPPLDQLIVWLSQTITAYRFSVRVNGEMLDLITQNLVLPEVSFHREAGILIKYQLVKTFKTSIPIRDDWKRPDFLTDPTLVYGWIKCQRLLWRGNLWV